MQDRKFVVAYLSLHKGELVQQVVYSQTAYTAVCDFLGTIPIGCKTLEDLKQYAADSDMYISVLEIDQPCTLQGFFTLCRKGNIYIILALLGVSK